MLHYVLCDVPPAAFREKKSEVYDRDFCSGMCGCADPFRTGDSDGRLHDPSDGDVFHWYAVLSVSG